MVESGNILASIILPVGSVTRDDLFDESNRSMRHQIADQNNVGQILTQSSTVGNSNSHSNLFGSPERKRSRNNVDTIVSPLFRSPSASSVASNKRRYYNTPMRSSGSCDTTVRHSPLTSTPSPCYSSRWHASVKHPQEWTPQNYHNTPQLVSRLFTSRSEFHTIRTGFSESGWKYPSVNPDSNVLLDLCRTGRWREAYTRCQSHPEENFPVPLPCVPQSERTHGSKLYHKTPLGEVCRTISVLDYDKNEIRCGSLLVKTLIQAFPHQVRCRQGDEESTALLIAAKNRNVPFEVFKMLIDADLLLQRQENMQSSETMAAIQHDKLGCAPLYALISGLYIQEDALISIKYLLEHCPEAARVCSDFDKDISLSSPDLSSRTSSIDVFENDQERKLSPLIRLLCNRKLAAPRLGPGEGESATVYESDVVACATILLKCNPELIQTKSASSHCTALHLALKNYGRCSALTEVLLEFDPTRAMAVIQNFQGDLPLHVACDSGVSLPVLELVLEYTLGAAEVDTHTHSHVGPHPYIWRENRRKNTPLHLEWMNRVEGKKRIDPRVPGLDSRVPSWSHDSSCYVKLLEEGVKNVLQQMNTSKTSGLDAARSVLGPRFIDRTTSIVNCAQTRIVSMVAGDDLEGQRQKLDMHDQCFLLHKLCSFSSGVLPGPTLPTPYIHLFLCMFPEQVSLADECGKLPLHYACTFYGEKDCVKTNEAIESEPKQPHGWLEEGVCRESHVDILLHRNPNAARVADNTNRLPLHHTIESLKKIRIHNHSQKTTEGCDIQDNVKESIDGFFDSESSNMWKENVESLVKAFPDGVERRDPKSRLYPFMQAAAGPGTCLETVYFLLSQSPTLVMIQK